MGIFDKINKQTFNPYKVTEIEGSKINLKLVDLVNGYGIGRWFKLRAVSYKNGDANTISKKLVIAVIDVPISAGYATVYTKLPDFMLDDIIDLLALEEFITCVKQGKVGISPMPYEKDGQTYYKALFGMMDQDFEKFTESVNHKFVSKKIVNAKGEEVTIFVVEKEVDCNES